MKSVAWPIMLLLLIFSAGLLHADDGVIVTKSKDRFRPKKGVRGVIGVKAGVFSKGSFNAHDPYRTDVGVSAEVFADFPIARQAYLGFAFDFHNVKILRSSAVMIDLGLTFKPSFDIKSGEVFIQPVAAVGIGILPQFNVFDESRYLTTRLAVEAVFKFRRREMWILEVGLFRAPKGQSDDQDITIGTMVYARVGYGYR